MQLERDQSSSVALVGCFYHLEPLGDIQASSGLVMLSSEQLASSEIGLGTMLQNHVSQGGSNS